MREAARASASAAGTPPSASRAASRARQARKTAAAWSRSVVDSAATVTAMTAQPAWKSDRISTSRQMCRNQAATSRGARLSVQKLDGDVARSVESRLDQLVLPPPGSGGRSSHAAHRRLSTHVAERRGLQPATCQQPDGAVDHAVARPLGHLTFDVVGRIMTAIIRDAPADGASSASRDPVLA